MSNLNNVLKIQSLITQLTNIENIYIITNICSILIRMSFEYIKKIDRKEILTIPAYENAVVILTELVNNKNTYNSETELITAYQDKIIQLEKENLKDYFEKENNTDDDNIDFIN